MRIGIFTYGMANQLTGIGRYTVELLHRLRALFPSLEIVLINPYPESSLPVYQEFEQHSVPRLAKLPSVLSIGARTLDEVARARKLDILHDPCGIAPFPLTRSRRGSYKRVVTVHDAIPFLFPRLQPVLTRVAFQTRVRWSRFSTDAIITVSECSKTDLLHHIKAAETKFHVTELGTVKPNPNEIDMWRRRKDVVEAHGIKVPYFLYVGSINARKNVGRALAAFRDLLAAGFPAQFVIAGPRTRLSESERLLVNNLGTAVIFTDYLSEESLHILYANAAAVVYPSLYEGFGLPVLEGMAHEVPVISSNTSSIPEVAGDAALLVNPTDTEEIFSAMKSILTDSVFAQQLGAAGYTRASRFDWDKTARQTFEIYENLLR